MYAQVLQPVVQRCWVFMHAPILQPVVQRCWVFMHAPILTACCTEILGLHACTNLTACCTEEGKQAPTSVNKWRLGKSKKKSFTLPQPGVKLLPVAKHVSQVTTTPHLVQRSNPDCSSTFSNMVFGICYMAAQFPHRINETKDTAALAMSIQSSFWCLIQTQ